MAATVEQGSPEEGAATPAPTGSTSLLGKFNFKSLVNKKAKEPTAQAA